MAIKDIPIDIEIVGETVYLTVDRIGYPMPLDEFLRIAKHGIEDGRVLLTNAAINAGLSGATTVETVLIALKGKLLKG